MINSVSAGDTGWTHHCNPRGGLHVWRASVIAALLLLLAWVLVVLDEDMMSG
jgi:hypothetical protein